MSKAGRGLAVAAAAIAATIVFGFVLFATAVMRDEPQPEQRADGIVVLTGGELRIAEGARLLAKGWGRRLLISGVNPKTSRHDVVRITGLGEAQFDCCVDLGYWAQDTVGNADETKVWAEQHQFASLIVVTSSYHMPRSLAELSIELPRTRLIAHPVTPRSLRHHAWWLHLATTRVLLSEYVKFLPTAARLTAARLPWPFGTTSHAGRSDIHAGRM